MNQSGENAGLLNVAEAVEYLNKKLDDDGNISNSYTAENVREAAENKEIQYEKNSEEYLFELEWLHDYLTNEHSTSKFESGASGPPEVATKTTVDGLGSRSGVSISDRIKNSPPLIFAGAAIAGFTFAQT